MARKTSMLAPGWWDYTTLDNALLDDVAKLNANDLQELSREGFRVVYITFMGHIFKTGCFMIQTIIGE